MTPVATSERTRIVPRIIPEPRTCCPCICTTHLHLYHENVLEVMSYGLQLLDNALSLRGDYSGLLNSSRGTGWLSDCRQPLPNRVTSGFPVIRPESVPSARSLPTSLLYRDFGFVLAHAIWRTRTAMRCPA